MAWSEKYRLGVWFIYEFRLGLYNIRGPSFAPLWSLYNIREPSFDPPHPHPPPPHPSLQLGLQILILYIYNRRKYIRSCRNILENTFDVNNINSPCTRRRSCMFQQRYFDFEVFSKRVGRKILCVAMLFMCDVMVLTEIVMSSLAMSVNTD